MNDFTLLTHMELLKLAGENKETIRLAGIAIEDYKETIRDLEAVILDLKNQVTDLMDTKAKRNLLIKQLRSKIKKEIFTEIDCLKNDIAKLEVLRDQQMLIINQK